MPEVCINCEKKVSVYWYCDEESEGAWCPDCFEKTACGQGAHGEGCPTKVFDTEE